VYLEWAQYPLITEATSGQNTSVHFKDLRFDYPQFRGRVTLSAWIEVTPNLEIVREGFGTGEQKPPL